MLTYPKESVEMYEQKALLRMYSGRHCHNRNVTKLRWPQRRKRLKHNGSVVETNPNLGRGLASLWTSRYLP